MFMIGHIEGECRRIEYGFWPFKKALFELLDPYQHKLATNGFQSAHTPSISIGKNLCGADICIQITDGELQLPKYYLWDGASGPAFNHPTTLRATAVHDALYILIQKRQDQFRPIKEYRKAADREMRQILHADSHTRTRGRIWYWAVRFFGQSRPTKTMPRLATALVVQKGLIE